MTNHVAEHNEMNENKSNQINLRLLDIKKYHDCHRRKGGLQKATRWTMLQADRRN